LGLNDISDQKTAFRLKGKSLASLGEMSEGSQQKDFYQKALKAYQQALKFDEGDKETQRNFIKVQKWLDENKT
jgi:hypothetical protein